MQWWEHSPPNNEASVQIQASKPLICGSSFFLVLSLAPRGFSPSIQIFPAPQKPTLPNFNSIWNERTRLSEFTRTPKCFVGNQTTMYNYNGINRISTEK